MIIKYKNQYYKLEKTVVSSDKEVSFNLSEIHTEYFGDGILFGLLFLGPIIIVGTVFFTGICVN